MRNVVTVPELLDGHTVLDIECLDRIYLQPLTRPDHWPMVNGTGAAIAEDCGEVDRVFPLGTTTRDAVLAEAQRQAEQKAIAAGARPGSVSVVDIDEVALTYMPGNTTRVRVKAVGQLDVASGSARGAPSRPTALSGSNHYRSRWGDHNVPICTRAKLPAAHRRGASR